MEVAFLEKRDDELATLGFRPIVTYRMTNAPRPLLGRAWRREPRTKPS
jgi:hypothetical protein